MKKRKHFGRVLTEIKKFLHICTCLNTMVFTFKGHFQGFFLLISSCFFCCRQCGVAGCCQQY